MYILNATSLSTLKSSKSMTLVWYLLSDAADLIQSESRALLEPNDTHKKLSDKH
jgi:hypothetical protein